MIVKGGFTNYGEPIGILMLETRFARPVGDIGNAGTFDFPVKYRIVKGASPDRIVREKDPELLTPFIEAALELQSQGVKAVTTSCGFLSLFQTAIAEVMDIPFFSSSLMQIPLVYMMMGSKGKIGVLTVNGQSLTTECLSAVGADGYPLVIRGMEHTRYFAANYMNSSLKGASGDYDLDYAACLEEVRSAALELVYSDTAVRAVLMECTNMPSYREAVREATGLPVFDILSLVNMVHSAMV